MAISAEKRKAIALAVDKLDKDHGAGAVILLGDKPQSDIEVISTGSIGLDTALGVGGLPKGRIVEIYGPESSGKTTLTIHAMAEAQKAGGVVAIVDAEHAFDKAYAEKLGVNVDELYISQPKSGEEGLQILDKLIQTAAFDIIVVDSVAALVPQAELDGEMGDSKMGLHARLMSQAMRKITGSIEKTGTIVIFINQLREKIGVMFGNPETTTGGNALKFYASIRLDIRRVSQLKDGDNIYGNHVKVKVAKNKVAAPFKTAEFDLIFGEGISKAGEIVNLGVTYGIIQKAGSWFSYGNDKLGQGAAAVAQLMQDNPALADEIEAKIREQIANNE